jgi:16S rRNA (uracil1498-N3)-methyltransferase
MTYRYYSPTLLATGGIIALPEDEAAHAARVMRIQIGDPVVLFSGDNHEAQGRVASVDRKNVFIQAEPPQFVSRELECSIHVVVSLPKGDRAKVLVEKLTELGVARVTPVICARTQGAPSDNAIVKLRRAVIESSKQCGRNCLMTIDDVRAFTPWLRTHEPSSQGRASSLDLIAHPDGHSLASTLASQDHRAACLLVGPEGGFTDDEVELAVHHGWQRVSLGQRILRIETAAVAIVARLALNT